MVVWALPIGQHQSSFEMPALNEAAAVSSAGGRLRIKRVNFTLKPKQKEICNNSMSNTYKWRHQ